MKFAPVFRIVTVSRMGLSCCWLIAIIWGQQVVADPQVVTLRESSGNLSPHNISVSSDKKPQLAVAVLTGDALFASKQFELSANGVVALNKLIGDLQAYDDIVSIRIVGHSDSIGRRGDNLVLSEKRAQYIRQLFVERLADIPITALGAGESTPVTSNDTPEGRNRNRRVEIQVIATGIKPAVEPRSSDNISGLNTPQDSISDAVNQSVIKP